MGSPQRAGVRELAYLMMLPLAGLEVKARRLPCSFESLTNPVFKAELAKLRAFFIASDKLRCLFELQGHVGRDWH